MPNKELVGQYDSCLHQIGIGLGLGETETTLFVREILAQENHSYINRKYRMPPRILLAQRMVQKCLFHISSALFSQTCNNGKGAALYTPDIPLSFWAVYKLHRTLGFSETEIAQILNTSVLQVKERLQKAREYLLKIRNTC